MGCFCFGLRMMGGSSLGEDSIELAALLESVQVVETADVSLTDEYLRNGLAPAARDHFRAPVGMEHDVDFRVFDASLLQQALGGAAIAAKGRRVDEDFRILRHHFTSGRVSGRQPPRPPLNLYTRSRPAR